MLNIDPYGKSRPDIDRPSARVGGTTANLKHAVEYATTFVQLRPPSSIARRASGDNFGA